MKTMRICLLSILCLALLAGAAPRAPQSIEALMGTALRQEEVEGNLEAAIATYKKVIAAAGTPRALAATAQYRIGLCYEKLGSTEARQAYERVLKNYCRSKRYLFAGTGGACQAERRGQGAAKYRTHRAPRAGTLGFLVVRRRVARRALSVAF